MTKAASDSSSSACFGSCEGSHDPLYTVRPNVSSEDALIHLSCLLKSVYQTTLVACDRVDEDVRSLLWGNEHALDTGIALVESMLEEVQARARTSAAVMASQAESA